MALKSGRFSAPSLDSASSSFTTARQMLVGLQAAALPQRNRTGRDAVFGVSGQEIADGWQC
jgi:hypothetical protein